MAALAPKDSIHLVPSTSITIISDDGDERNESFLFEVRTVILHKLETSTA